MNSLAHIHWGTGCGCVRKPLMTESACTAVYTTFQATVYTSLDSTSSYTCMHDNIMIHVFARIFSLLIKTKLNSLRFH